MTFFKSSHPILGLFWVFFLCRPKYMRFIGKGRRPNEFICMFLKVYRNGPLSCLSHRVSRVAAQVYPSKENKFYWPLSSRRDIVRASQSQSPRDRDSISIENPDRDSISRALVRASRFLSDIWLTDDVPDIIGWWIVRRLTYNLCACTIQCGKKKITLSARIYSKIEFCTKFGLHRLIGELLH